MGSWQKMRSVNGVVSRRQLVRRCRLVPLLPIGPDRRRARCVFHNGPGRQVGLQSSASVVPPLGLDPRLDVWRSSRPVEQVRLSMRH